MHPPSAKRPRPRQLIPLPAAAYAGTPPPLRRGSRGGRAAHRASREMGACGRDLEAAAGAAPTHARPDCARG